MKLTSVGVLHLIICASTILTARGQTCPASSQKAFMCETGTVSSQNITLDVSRGANSGFSNCTCVLSSNISGFSVMFNSYPPSTNCTTKLTVMFVDKSIQVRCGAPPVPQTTSGTSATIVYVADYNVTTADSSYCLTFFGGTSEAQLTLTCDRPLVETATTTTTMSNATVTTPGNDTVATTATTVKYPDSFTSSYSSGVPDVTSLATSQTSAITLNITSNLTTASLENSNTTISPSSASHTSPISLSTTSTLTTSTIATTASALNKSSTLSSSTSNDSHTISVNVTSRSASVTTVTSSVNPPSTISTTPTHFSPTEIPTTEMLITNATQTSSKPKPTLSPGTTDNKTTTSGTSTISNTTLSDKSTVHSNLSTNGTTVSVLETTTVSPVTTSLETKTITTATTVTVQNTPEKGNNTGTTSLGTTDTPVPTTSTTVIQNTTLNSTDVSANNTTTSERGPTTPKITTTTPSFSLSTTNVTPPTTKTSTKPGTTTTDSANSYTPTTTGTETTVENTGLTNTPFTTFSTTPLMTDTTRTVSESIDNTTGVISPENLTTTAAFNETSTNDTFNGTSVGYDNTTELTTIQTTKSLDYGNYDEFDYEPETSNAVVIIIPLVSVLLLGVIGTFTFIVCKRLQRVKYEARRKSKEDAEKAEGRKDNNFKLQTGFLASSVQTELKTQRKTTDEDKDKYSEEKDVSSKQDKEALSATIDPIQEDNIKVKKDSVDSTLKDTINGGTLGKTKEYEPTQRERELLENLELSSIVLESDPDDPNRYFKKSDPGDWYRVIMKKKQPKGLDTLTYTDSSLNGTTSGKKSRKHRKRHKDSAEEKNEKRKRRKSKDRLDDVYKEMTNSLKDSKSKRDKHGKSKTKLDEVDGSNVPPDSLQPRVIVSKPIPTAETSAKLHEKVSQGKRSQPGDTIQSSQSSNTTDTLTKPSDKTGDCNIASVVIASPLKSKQPIKPVKRPDIVPPLNLKGT